MSSPLTKLIVQCVGISAFGIGSFIYLTGDNYQYKLKKNMDRIPTEMIGEASEREKLIMNELKKAAESPYNYAYLLSKGEQAMKKQKERTEKEIKKILKEDSSDSTNNADK